MKMKLEMPKRNKLSNGFTLIELLIVISVIAILTTLFVNTSTINLKRGRDAKRKTDLELVRSGIETYRADCNKYPLTDQITFGGVLTGNNSTVSCANANTYISAIPQDPSNSGGSAYLYSSNGNTYQLCANLEAPPSGAVTVACGGSSNCGTATCNYQVINP